MHMKVKNDKRRLRVHLVIVYSIMVVTVIVLATIMMFIVEGYRYNRYNGKVEQGGLVQFRSSPSGAAVDVDGTRLMARTSSKLTLGAGSHEVTMTKDGHTSWRKNVIVKPGGILWLDYAQLFPTTPITSTAATLPGVDSVLPSSNRRSMAIVTDAAKPELSLVSLDTDQPETTKIAIETEKYTAGTHHEFSLVAWDSDSRRVIIKHVYDSTAEYLSVDVRNGSTYNVTTLLGTDIQKIWYSRSDNNTVYIITANHELRRGNLNDATLSGPLVKNVSDAVMNSDSRVMYVTLPDNDGARSVGYVTTGKMVAKTIKTYKTLADPLSVASGEYYNDQYVAIIHGGTLTVLQGDLPSSDSKLPLEMKTVVSRSFKDNENTVGFSPDDNRIVYAVNGTYVFTYDLELMMASNITVANDLPGQLGSQVTTTPGLQWFDRRHIMSSGGPLYVYDYDGTNGRVLVKETARQPIVLSHGEKYIYYFATNGNTTLLNRIQITD